MLWGVVNFLQTTFTFALTGVGCLVGILLVGATGRAEPILRLARHVWARPLLWGARARLEVSGAERIDFAKPHVFVMNHQSTIDIPAAMYAIPVPVRFFVKRELGDLPVLGHYIRATGMVVIDRKDASRAAAGVPKAREIVAQGRSMIAFPEGSRTRDGAIGPFKRGVFLAAIRAGAPVVPMAIEGAGTMMPIGGFKIRPGVIRIAFGTPIPTAGLSPSDSARLSDEARSAVIALHQALANS
jgi:1-acyl-sn-glycerol-3-phosphate acyltransferase